MKTVIGIILGIVIGIIILVIVAVLVVIPAFVKTGSPTFSAPSPTTSPTTVVSSTPTPSTPGPTAPSPTSASPTPSASAAVNFRLFISNISGDGLTRVVTGEITNTGTASAHNTAVKIEAFHQDSRVQLNGTDSVNVNLGTIPAGETRTENVTIQLNFLDGLRVLQDGITLQLTITSDEKTQSINYDYRP